MRKFNTVELGQLTNNLDNRRIPLNASQRAEKESAPLYAYIGANKIMGYIDDYIFDEKILCVAEDGGAWGYNEKCANIYNERVWVNNHAHVLTAKESVILEYLMHFLNHSDLSLYINGATRGKLTRKSLDSIKIPLPPLETQKKIAEILDAADSLRQKTKTLIEKYDQLTQSLFLAMFGDPVSNTKKWKFVRLGELNNITSGSTPSRKNSDCFAGSIPWVKTGEVNGGVINGTEEKISKEALSNSSCKLYPKGSIIIAMYGQGKTRGKVATLGIEATTNQACAVIPPSSEMDYGFLFYLLKLCYDDIRNLGRGGNQPNLNVGLVKNYVVINPPLPLQNQFADRVQAIEEEKAKAQASLEKSEELFQSLLQKAFRGEIN